MKRIFNETKTEELQNPDLMYGYLKYDKLLIAHHDAQEEVKEQKHEELLHEYPNGGKEYIEVIDVPYQPAKEAWDEYEDIQVYIPYTEEELTTIAARNAIVEAKAFLEKTDYIVLKIAEATAEGDAEGVAALQAEYAEQLVKRKQARMTVNENEQAIITLGLSL